ncbi:MAG: 4Fe-4S binding protein [Armatimonadetes bacterium]|nr:4Fe-4S binding protein [Armatimonadota bacterium]
MKQIVTLSGKGGTGKTTVLGSFAALAGDTVLADCDVDAANLYLLLHPQPERTGEYRGARIAVRDPARCAQCGECERRCRFDAITVEAVSAAACEGCGLCVLACPREALTLQTVVNGVLYEGMTTYGPMVHARLSPAAENSGRLVTVVRQRAEEVARRTGRSLILMDGPPGIACTATASLVDTDLAVIVTEPSLSGMHDMARVVQLAEQLRVPMAAIINKADINPDNAADIAEFCASRNIPLLASLPFEEVVVKANAAQIPLVEYDDGPVSQGLRKAWERIWGLAG